MNSKETNLQFYNDINKILTEWNPLGVPKDIAESEYTGYIPFLINYYKENNNFYDGLIQILTNEFGMDKEKFIKKDFDELEEINMKLKKIM